MHFAGYDAGASSYAVDPFGNVVESFRKLDALPRPSDTITVFECANALGASIYNDHTHSRNWSSWVAVTLA